MKILRRALTVLPRAVRATWIRPRSISADEQGDKRRAMSMMVVVGSHNGTEAKGAHLVAHKAKVAAAVMIWARAALSMHRSTPLLCEVVEVRHDGGWSERSRSSCGAWTPACQGSAWHPWTTMVVNVCRSSLSWGKERHG